MSSYRAKGLNGQHIPQTDTARYLCIHLDRRLKWQKHIFTERKQLGLQLHRMYWIIGRKSRLSLENKLLISQNYPKAHLDVRHPPTWVQQVIPTSKYCNDFKTRFSDPFSTLHSTYRTLYYTPICRYPQLTL